MDISKYRAKYPPREHEEAVRMLLEGLDKPTSQNDLNEIPSSQTSRQMGATDREPKKTRIRQREHSKLNRMTPSRHSVARDHQSSPASSVDSGSLARGLSDYDDEQQYELESAARARTRASREHDDSALVFNSEESSSREFSIQVSPQILSKRGHVLAKSRTLDHHQNSVRPSLPKMQSKATSTASDSISTSGASSGSRANELAAMAQETLNGDYEAIPSRTIAIQCDLKLSSVKRDGYLDSASTDLASMQASSISSTRYGFYRLSAGTLERRRQLARSVSSRNIAHGAAPPEPRNVAEAPTSMSELSSDEEEEAGGFDRELAEVVGRKSSLLQQSVHDDVDDVDEGSLADRGTRDLRHRASERADQMRINRDERLFCQQQQRTSASRARQESLPRRPKTALSYVSTSRQRAGSDSGEQTPDRSLSDQERDHQGCNLLASRRMTPRSRALSQHVLSSTGRPGQRVSASRGSAEPASELDDARGRSIRDSEFDAQQVARQEEFVVTPIRDRPSMGASPQVRRSENIRKGPLLRRYATLTTADSTTARPHIYRQAAPDQQLRDRQLIREQAEQTYQNNSSQVGERAHQRRLRDMSANLGSGVHHSTMDEENQISAAERQNRDSAASADRQQQQQQQHQPKGRYGSMSLSTARTWTNPSSARRQASHQSVHNLDNDSSSTDCRRPSHQFAASRPLNRKTARSLSMRDVNQGLEGSGTTALPCNSTNQLLMSAQHQRPRRFESIYRAGQQLDNEDEARKPGDAFPTEDLSVCSTSSIDGATREVLTRAQAHHQPLDFDSQQRLNEIGLPEPGHSMSSGSTKRVSSSHLGLSVGLSAGLAGAADRYATTGRNSFRRSSRLAGPALITGRAMSHQSLTRPTMPLSRRLRRSGGGASAGSGSDIGGSSMSLVSRLRDGSRYENAHTRTPVVMLIPQAPSLAKQGDLLRSEANSRRASSRLGRSLGKTPGSRVSSQDRSHRRSVSRNNSDSESSSSMLRTLVKPRVNRVNSTNKSVRRKQMNGGARDGSDLEENMDGVGQLATEIDSYKFRRRYSVPKDAKINWFSKLKQRVTSKS